MATLPVTVTVNDKSGVYSVAYSGSGINSSNQIKVPNGSTANITLTLSAGTGTSSLSFATPAITWFNSSNPSIPISTPVPFTVTEESGGVTIADDNSVAANNGTFSFLVNVLANGLLVQSPDPTIINEGTNQERQQLPPRQAA